MCCIGAARVKGEAAERTYSTAEPRRKYGFGGIVPLRLRRLSIQSGYMSVWRILSSMPTPKLLNHVGIIARVKRFSLSTERAYVNGELAIRKGKGAKDRLTMLPANAREPSHTPKQNPAHKKSRPPDRIRGAIYDKTSQTAERQHRARGPTHGS